MRKSGVNNFGFSVVGVTPDVDKDDDIDDDDDVDKERDDNAGDEYDGCMDDA